MELTLYAAKYTRRVQISAMLMFPAVREQETVKCVPLTFIGNQTIVYPLASGTRYSNRIMHLLKQESWLIFCVPDVAQNPVRISKQLTKNKGWASLKFHLLQTSLSKIFHIFLLMKPCKLQSVGSLQPEDFSVSEEIQSRWLWPVHAYLTASASDERGS